MNEENNNVVPEMKPLDEIEKLDGTESIQPVESLDQPVVSAPVQEAVAPVVEAPVQEAVAPVVEAPVQESVAPVVETPVQEAVAPVVEAPVQEAVAPVVEAPVQEAVAPVVETPVQEAVAPVVEAPVQEPVTPVVEAPVQEVVAPVVEAPAQAPVQESVPAPTNGVAEIKPTPEAAPVQQPAAPVPPTDGNEKKKGNPLFIILIIIILAAIGVAVYFFVIKGNEEKTPAATSTPTPTPEVTPTPTPKVINSKPTKVEGATTVEIGQYTMNLPDGYELERFEDDTAIIVNNTKYTGVVFREVGGPASIDTAMSNSDSVVSSLTADGYEVLENSSKVTLDNIEWVQVPTSINGDTLLYGVFVVEDTYIEAYIYSYQQTTPHGEVMSDINSVIPTIVNTNESYTPETELYDNSIKDLFSGVIFDSTDE